MQTVTVLFEEAAQILNVLQLLQISDLPQYYSVTLEQLRQLSLRLEEAIAESSATSENQATSQLPVMAQVPVATNITATSSENILVLRRISGRDTDNVVVARRALNSAPFGDEIAYLNTEATPAGMSAIRALAQLIE